MDSASLMKAESKTISSGRGEVTCENIIAYWDPFYLVSPFKKHFEGHYLHAFSE